METLKEYLTPGVIWFLIAIIVLLMEFVVPGLIIFFFGIGALIVSIICFITDISINVQLIIFIVSSIILLVSLRKWLTGVFKGYVGSKHQDNSENFDEYIGQKAVVKNEILAKQGGRVEFHGTEWQAEAEASIAAGTPVVITGKDNLVLKVKPL